MIAWLTSKLAGFAFGSFIKNAGPVLLPAVVLAIAAGFAWVQSATIKRLEVQVASLETQLATCEANVASVLRDKLRDDEIDDLSNSDLIQRAIDNGWLRPVDTSTETNGSGLLPD